VAGYGAILILFGIGAGIASILWTLATVVGPKAPNPRKAEPFECGNPPLGETPRRVTVKFYVVALMFIAFDMETVFLYPWALSFQELGWTGFMYMVTFVAILSLGLVYVWRKGALDWK
jgi:NADH-quinone oxidoreductase subunit A